MSHPVTHGKGRAWRLNQSPVAIDLINLMYVIKPPQTTPSPCKVWGGRLESFQVTKHMEMLGEWYTWREHDSSAPFPPYLALCTSSIWLFFYILWNILSNKLVMISRLFFWVLCAILANDQTQGGSCWNLQIMAGWWDAQVTIWTHEWYLMWGQSCRIDHTVCGIWCYLQVFIVRTDLNCRTPGWRAPTSWRIA